MGRTSPICLYAPENYQRILHSHLEDFDITLNFEINFVPLSGNSKVKIYEDKYLTVTTFPLKHRVPAFGFLFREKPYDRNIIKECIEKYRIPAVRIPAIKKGEDFITDEGELIRNEDLTRPGPEPLSYAYCSDTKYFKRLAKYVTGVSLLYHEATFDQTLSELAHITGHSTSLDAARTASEAGAGTLIIGHFSARYKDIIPLVEEARTIFPDTLAAIDGKSYDAGEKFTP